MISYSYDRTIGAKDSYLKRFSIRILSVIIIYMYLLIFSGGSPFFSVTQLLTLHSVHTKFRNIILSHMKHQNNAYCFFNESARHVIFLLMYAYS